MVHKKKHDMVLNLGLGARGNTFSDQTPTPTQFIRNCEEVGLFQDLQNVNPFEETFRRAVEAVKAGQTPILDKPFQSNPCDDTLHTPNVFPHITHLPGGNQNSDIVRLENKRHNDNLPKKDNMKNSDEKELHSKIILEPNMPKNLNLENISHKKRKQNVGDEFVIEEVQNDQNLLLNEKKEETCLKNISTNNSANDLIQKQMAIKEKIKNNIHNKQMPMLLQLKVPIPKSKSMSRCQKSQKDRFSTFSKNSLKYECNMENSESGIFDLNKKRNITKNYSGLSKEKIEILERNRAAATRCRQKKKIYVSYLEKLNRELTDTNKKLAHHNNYLKKQVSDLQAELLKHHSCSVSNTKEENFIVSIGNCEINCKSVEQFEIAGKVSKSLKNRMASQDNSETRNEIEGVEVVSNNPEVSLTDKFSSEVQNVSDTVNNESFTATYSKPCSMKSFYEEDKLRKVYIDHSYFNYPSLPKIRKKCTARSKFIPGFLTSNVKNQNFIKGNHKTVGLLSEPESVLEVQTEDLSL